jgi:LPPG:FO 2-phospho-L-lactate transferase
VLEALASAQAIVIGPSNPVISIAPILALPDLRDHLRVSQAAVVAVSPVVEGQVLKPATTPFMDWAGHPVSPAGIAAYYAGVIDGIVCDESLDGLPVLQTDVLMEGAQGRRRLAQEALEFALSLR